MNTRNTEIETGEPTDPCPTTPTIEATGRASHEHAPKIGQVWVTVEGKGSSREAAWEQFQQRHTEIKGVLDALGSTDNVMPSESEEEVSRGLRSLTEFTVVDRVVVTFDPSSFGEVISALIACDAKFSTPVFTFEKIPQVTPDLMTAAAADARINAAAIVAGVGARLGRLVSINLGTPQLAKIVRPTSSFLDMVSLSMASRAAASIDFDEEKLETYDTVVHVTVKYEVIEPVDEMEVRA